MKQWCVYVIACEDNSLYTGSTNDLHRRFKQHTDGHGARYTRSHPPLKIECCIECIDRSHAQCVELAIKRLTRVEKLTLINLINVMMILEDAC